MSYAIAVARSRERAAVTVVETIARSEERDLRVVTLAERLPAESSPAEQYEAVVALSDAAREQNFGHEPRIVVLQDAVGTSLVELLREDFRERRRDRRPTALTVVGASADGRAAYVGPNYLMAMLYREWRAGRIVVAPDLPGLDRMRAQMGSFAPRESRAGRLSWGDESVAEYDDMVVSLACASFVRGYGVTRFVDQRGNVWPSRLIAQAKVGALAR